MRQWLVGALFFWAAVIVLRLVWNAARTAPAPQCNCPAGPVTGEPPGPAVLGPTYSEEAPPAAPPKADLPPRPRHRRVAQIRSGGDWGVYDSDPGDTRAAQRLGDATPVCLNDSAPERCPSDATPYGYPAGAWRADLTEIPGAVWIWTPGASGDRPAELRRFFFFSRTYRLGDFPTGWIDVAVDDAAEVRVDGRVVGSVGSVVNEPQASSAQSRLTRFDLTPFLHAGANVITVGAENGPFACRTRALACNPAGVVFGGVLTSVR
jgi:hypothetical protein